MQKQLKLIIFTIFLLLFSILFNFYIASRGVFHVDTFVHFDSAFRILKGDVPTRDFLDSTWIISRLYPIFFFSIYLDLVGFLTFFILQFLTQSFVYFHFIFFIII